MHCACFFYFFLTIREWGILEVCCACDFTNCMEKSCRKKIIGQNNFLKIDILHFLDDIFLKNVYLLHAILERKIFTKIGIKLKKMEKKPLKLEKIGSKLVVRQKNWLSVRIFRNSKNL